MKTEVKEGLDYCIRVAKILKERFPNDLMKIDNNTIVVHSVENSRLLGGKKHMGSMSNQYAHYDNERKRIVIKQKYLINPIMLRTKVQNKSDRVMLDGNFALIELMCHELAHHKTTGHAKSFKIKYKKFLNYMVSVIFSGGMNQ